MSDYNVDASGRFPIKAWTKGVQVEDVAAEQLRNMANMPFIHKHVAVMPDVHWGMGATIGSVISTKVAAKVPVVIQVGRALPAGGVPESVEDGLQRLHNIVIVSQ